MISVVGDALRGFHSHGCLSIIWTIQPPRYSHQCMADGISWELQSFGMEYFLHHLDDFSDPGAGWLKPMQGEWGGELSRLQSQCAMGLGFPVASTKIIGSTMILVFLRIEIDTVAWETRLQKNKLARLQELITS